MERREDQRHESFELSTIRHSPAMVEGFQVRRWNPIFSKLVSNSESRELRDHH